MQPLGMRPTRRHSSAMWAVIAASFGLASPATAIDREVSTASGEPIVIARHMQWKTKDCTANGLPVVKINRQPAHGAANLTAGPTIIGINRASPGQDQCRGKEITGVLLNYLPNPEFVGTDIVTYTVTLSSGSYTNTVTIDVLPSANAERKKADTTVASVGPPNAFTPRTTQPAGEAAKAAAASSDTGTSIAKPTELTGNRIALVIGNAAYKNVPALTNPTRDADTIASALRSAGFQTVQLRSDLTREKLTDALQTFAAEADKADWAVVYFAGHGLEVNGINYLIPVDARLAIDRDVEFEAVPLDRVMSAVGSAKRLRLVPLDACRDNPFVNQMRRSVATRSTGRGLTNVEPEAGTLVVYAAKHGQVALDGDGGNSPFVTALTKRMQTPGLEIRRLFDHVRDDVLEMTNRAQQPFSYGSLPGSEDYYFRASATVKQP
ncbi:MAG: caspase family protein [Xanthobacteraceae bacterium]